MSAPQVVNLPVDLIERSKRLRQVDEDAVKTLALSMQETDEAGNAIRRQITPITVRPGDAGRYILVVGAHRLAAAKLLGWPEIEAFVKNLTDDEALDEEIDENLYRKDLTGADRTMFVTKKLALFTYSGRKFKRGRDLRKGPTVGLLEGDAPAKEVIGFYQDLEKKFGIKRSTAKKLVRRGRNISAGLWDIIGNSKKAIPDALLDKLAALTDQEREEVESRVVSRGCSLSEAVKAVAPSAGRPIRTPEDVADGLATTWAAWNASEQSRFIKALRGTKNAR